MAGDPDTCMICGNEECPGSWDPMDCEFYWDVFDDGEEDEGEWLDEDDYARHQDFDDDE